MDLSGFTDSYWLIVPAQAGPRGNVGQQTSTASVPGWPGVFTSSHSTFASLQSAVNAAGTNRVFEITSSFPFTAVITPHSGDQFWGDPGVTITRSGAISNAFNPGAAAPDVKIMNLTFDGFNAGTGSGIGNSTDQVLFNFSSDRWEVAYCNFLNTYYAANFATSSNCSLHHCNMHDIGAALAGFRGRDHSFTDNILGPNIGDATSTGGTKFVATQRIQFAHNECNGGVRCGVWFDTSCSETLIEWNNIHGTGSGSPMGSVVMEVCEWIDGTVTGNDTATEITQQTSNIIRNNWIHNNMNNGINILNSPQTYAYYNVLSGNLTGSGQSEILMRRDGNTTTTHGAFTMHYDLHDVLLHHNQITPLDSTKKTIYLDILNTSDTSPYYTNIKNLNVDYDIYAGLASSSSFVWNGNKTFAQWQTVPQGPNGSAATQDYHSGTGSQSFVTASYSPRGMIFTHLA